MLCGSSCYLASNTSQTQLLLHYCGAFYAGLEPRMCLSVRVLAWHAWGIGDQSSQMGGT